MNKVKSKKKGRGCLFAVLVTFLICLAIILFVRDRRRIVVYAHYPDT